MPNMACIIKGHNQKVLAPADVRKPAEECNCRAKPSCPLDGRCLQEMVVYQANVTARSSGDERRYFGLCETPFKTRYSNHLTTMRYEKYRKSTQLSKHLWALQDQGEEYDIRWSIVDRAKTYSNISKRCGLCFSGEGENHPR